LSWLYLQTISVSIPDKVITIPVFTNCGGHVLTEINQITDPVKWNSFVKDEIAALTAN